MPRAETESKPPIVAAFLGDDLFLTLSAMKELLRALSPDSQAIDFDGDTADLAAVLDEARSFAMFGGAKAVVIRNAENFIKKYRDKLEDYFEKESGGALLIFRDSKLKSNERLYKLIEKKGRVIRCEAPKDPTNWIIERAKHPHNFSITPDAARVLADLLGNDLGRLDMELSKLALICEGGTVHAKDITGAVAFQREREMWDLTNALASGDSAAALRRWRQLVQLESSAEFRAVTWLGLWLEKVDKTLDMLEEGQNANAIGQALKIWPRDAAEKFVHTARDLGRHGLAAAMNLLAQTDFQTKTGIGDAAENVERFILSMAAR